MATLRYINNSRTGEPGTLVELDSPLQFYDDNAYIYGSSSGVLNLTSTTLDLNATTLDIDATTIQLTGALEFTGDLTYTGALDIVGAMTFSDTLNATQTAIAITDAAGNGRRCYWQFTAASIESGEQLTGLQLRANWGGTANATAAGITGIEIKARASSDSITHTVGTAKAIIANVDAKKSTFTTAWGVESQFDISAGGTITTGAAFRASLNNSGTFTTSYAYLVETANTALNWDYGFYCGNGQADTGVYLGDCTCGIDFAGTYTSHALDFSDATQAAGDISLIRAGSYTSPMDAAGESQYGMVRLYLDTDDDGTSYNRGIFVCLKTSGTKGIFPIAGLAEVLTDATGPTKAQAAQFIVGLHEVGSNLATMGGDTTAGMYGAWLKVYSIVGSTAASGSRVAPVWVDNQMYGTISGEEYGIFATTGGTRPDGFIGFETTSSGYDQFIYCDTTFNSGAGTCFETSEVPTNATDARIKVWYDSKQYYIKLHR